MRILSTLVAAAVLAGAGLAASADAAKPSLCRPANIQHTLIEAGKLTAQDVKFGEVVDLVRCGDVTADGRKDAVFTVASGGTAGDTRFGVLSRGRLVLFDVIQPHYRATDPNCCPSSFRIRRYTWTASRFTAGHARNAKTAPRRFYRR